MVSIYSVLAVLAAVTSVVSEHGGDHGIGEVVHQVHGSGTTNPSKCYWSIMEQISARTKLTTRLTYRAVGSTTGISEFVNSYDPTVPANDFGSGGIPLNNTIYQTFKDADVGIVQLPVLLDAVSFFHSVPFVDNLTLTPCVLAQIFNGNIWGWTFWDIVQYNPSILDVDVGYIRVAHDVRDSSLTQAINNYFAAACPGGGWNEEYTGPLFNWKGGLQPNYTYPIECEGPDGMTTCIRERAGTIGYMYARDGINAGLAEIKIENNDGTFLSSAEAAANGGITVRSNSFPSTPDQDFSEVSLLNQGGKWTWPIILVTYIYVRQDLSYFEDPDFASLMVAFLRALVDEDYVQKCAENYGFVIPTQDVRDYTLSGINLLQLPENATNWIFEKGTLPIEGQDDYVISSKRQQISDIERSATQDDISALQTQNAELRAQINELQRTTDKQETQLMAALVLSCLCSFYLVIFSLLLLWIAGKSGKDTCLSQWFHSTPTPTE